MAITSDCNSVLIKATDERCSFITILNTTSYVSDLNFSGNGKYLAVSTE